MADTVLKILLEDTTPQGKVKAPDESSGSGGGGSAPSTPQPKSKKQAEDKDRDKAIAEGVRAGEHVARTVLRAIGLDDIYARAKEIKDTATTITRGIRAAATPKAVPAAATGSTTTTANLGAVASAAPIAGEPPIIPPPIAGAPAAGAAVEGAAAAGATEAGGAAAGLGSIAAAALPVVAAFAAIAATAIVVGVAFKKFTDSLDRVTDKLGKYSGAISEQQATMSVRRQLIDVERAQRLGGDVAKANDATARLWETVERLGYTIWEPMLRLFVALLPLLERLIGGLTAVEGSLGVAENTLEGILLFLKPNAAQQAQQQKDMIDAMKRLQAGLAALATGMPQNQPPPNIWNNVWTLPKGPLPGLGGPPVGQPTMPVPPVGP